MNENTKVYDIFAIRDHYPHKGAKTSSIFVHQQLIGIKKYNYKSLVLSPQPYFQHLEIRNFFSSRFKVNSLIDKYEGIDVIRPYFLKFPNQFFYSFSLRNLKNSINRVISNYSARLIHAHFGQNGVASIDLKRKRKIPLITSFYGYDSGRLGHKFRNYYADLGQVGDLFLALSSDMKRDLLKLGFPKEKIIVHHLGVNLEKFKNNSSQNRNFRFLAVANFEENKGLHHIISAFSRIRKERSDIELVLVGSGPYKYILSKLVKNLDIKDSVKFIDNFVSSDPRAVVQNEMARCDAFVLPAITTKKGHKQGTPVVLMEAQACSKPCISTLHAGIPEVVIDGKTGFLIEENNINSLEKAMRTFLSEPKLLQEFGRNARLHIEKNFNQELQIKELIKIYEQLM